MFTVNLSSFTTSYKQYRDWRGLIYSLLFLLLPYQIWDVYFVVRAMVPFCMVAERHESQRESGCSDPLISSDLVIAPTGRIVCMRTYQGSSRKLQPLE